MINILQSEYLKYKRTFFKKLIIIAPIFFTIFTLMCNQKYFIPMIFNLWPLIFMCIGTALLCCLSNKLEKKSGNYKGLLSHNINPAKIWISKILVMGFYMFISSIGFIIIVSIVEFLMLNQSITFLKICEGSLVIWITSLSLIPIYLFLSTAFGMAVSIGASIIGVSLGVVMAVKESWIYVPWSVPIRLMCPIIGVHPNGVPLKAGSSLLNSSVISKGIIVSITVFVILLIVTCIWFSKREVH